MRKSCFVLCLLLSVSCTDKSEELRGPIREAYRLRPDQRFLHAVDEIHRILSGAAAAEDVTAVSVEFEEGLWEIRHGKTKAGVVRELPDFPDLMMLLESWARSVHERFPLELAPASSSSSSDDFLAPRAARALRDVDTLWRNGSQNPELLFRATRALVALTVQMLDRMETADPLPAKALSLLALTKTLTDYPLEREESLLAYAMGYSAHALDVATRLPEGDPVEMRSPG